MNVLLSGSRGLVGSAVIRNLLSDAHSVSHLTRPGGPVVAGTVSWSPEDGILDAGAIEGFDAVIHLAGENIAGSRWNSEQKKRIYDSRIHSTRLLCGRLKTLRQPPATAVFASAVGYYGDRGDQILAEDSPPGSDFMAELCRDWEKETESLSGTSIRVVNLRIGAVLSMNGGMLPRLLPIFRAGLGGRLGSGHQYMSWIGIDDLVRIVRFVIDNDSVRGPANAVTPNPITNAEFTKTLARQLGRPALFAVPKFALRIMAGGVSEVLLAGARVMPEKLMNAEFRFTHPEMDDCLKQLLK